jgi:2-dehydropantoate 2-reductase
VKILCYGAGAVGCLISGRLSAASHDVLLLSRAEAAAEIRAHGLAIEEPDGRIIYARPRVITSLAQMRVDEAPPDLIIAAVKAYDLPEVIRDIAQACRAETPVLTLQNGIGSEEAAIDVLGSERVVAGSFTLNVSLPEPGRVAQHTRSGGIALAEAHPSGKRLRSLVDLFTTSDIRAQAYPDWRAMKWSKLLLNLLANASCAILDVTPAEVLLHPALFRMERAAFLEARRVMRRLHLRPVDLPGYPVRRLAFAMGLPAPLARRLVAGRAAGGRGSKPPSLALDLARGKGQSEVRFLNGAVARVASEQGMRAPVNASLASTLEALAQGAADHATYRHSPKALLAECGLSR